MPAVLIALSLAVASGGSSPPKIERAVQRMMNAEFDTARRDLRLLAAARPDDPEILFYGVGACWWDEMSRDPDGDGRACLAPLERALTRIDGLIERHPSDGTLRYFRGRLFGQRLRINAVGGRTSKIAGDLRRMHADLEKAESLDPRIRARSAEMGLYHSIVDRIPSMARFLRVLLFVPGGDKREGLERLRLVARSGGLEAVEAQLYLGLVEIRFENQVGRGVDRLLGLMARFPGNTFLAIHIGDTLRRRLHQPREARRLYQRAHDGAGDLAAARRWAELGVALTLADDRDLTGAIALLEPLTHFDDSTAEEALIGLVAIHRLRGDGPAAQRAYRRMKRFDRRWSERYRGLALGILRKPPADGEVAAARAMDAGRTAERAGDEAAAEAAYLGAIAAVQGEARARFALAEIDLRNGRLEPVHRACDHLLRAPGVPLEIVAICTLRLGQIADARDDRRSAIVAYDELLDRPGLPFLKEEARRYQRAPFRADAD